MSAHDIALHCSAPLSIDTFDPETRTVEATISTFSDVARRDARGGFIKRLDPAGLDLSNLTGVPLLDGHRQGSGRDVIGASAQLSPFGWKARTLLQPSFCRARPM